MPEKVQVPYSTAQRFHDVTAVEVARRTFEPAALDAAAASVDSLPLPPHAASNTAAHALDTAAIE
ncbi:hypothetical protein EGT07_26860 [Herbaspirillum sp. HC18]|nr:hypothetical protein EGT07_26860 [Herbaspirillum sp. HC18]